eukprot:1141997-Pelagomonas_calceolata.AAC.9
MAPTTNLPANLNRESPSAALLACLPGSAFLRCWSTRGTGAQAPRCLPAPCPGHACCLGALLIAASPALAPRCLPAPCPGHACCLGALLIAASPALAPRCLPAPCPGHACCLGACLSLLPLPWLLAACLHHALDKRINCQLRIVLHGLLLAACTACQAEVAVPSAPHCHASNCRAPKSTAVLFA